MLEVMLYALGVLIMLIGLAVSIALHEVGHLVPAKLFGVKVTQYMIGFGKTLWSKRKGETEYGFKLLPLGGFVAMSGMYPPEKPGGQARDASTGFIDSLAADARDFSAETIDAGEDHRTFYQLPVWKKIIIMLGGPFMNLLLATLCFGIVLMGFGVPQTTTKLGYVAECLLPASSDQTECGLGDPQAPAAEAGLQPGDRIVAIEGTDITDWAQLSTIVSAAPGEALSFEIERDGQPRTVSVTPAATERWVYDEQGEQLFGDDGEPRTQTIGMIGVNATVEITKQPITAVPPFVAENAKLVAQVIIGLPQRMVDVWNAAFGSEERDPNGPIGVVGVGRIAGEVVSMDHAPVEARVEMIVRLLGSLNMALFVFNLVPLMPLDGGHVLGALYEGAKRRLYKLFGRPDPGPVDTAKMVPVTFVVVILLGAMSLLLAYADIFKPVQLFG